MNKRVVSFVLSLVMILTMVPVTAMAASADQFTDVTKDKWYYSWINNVVEKDYFKGTSETKFSPNVAMTRGMFVTVLAKMEGVDLQAKTSAFGDVPVTKYYAGAAKWASENKIVSGYPDGTFKGESIVSREQMAAIMQNYINWRSAKTGEIHVTNGSKAKFADDAKISAYAKEAVYDCREWGLVDGYLDGTFCPQNGSTRAEVAAVISKLDWLVNGGGGFSGNNNNNNNPHVHTYTSVETLPTCDADGFTTYTCSCSDTYTVQHSGSKLGHAWDLTHSAITTPATCTVAGVRTYTCINDAAHTSTEAISATGHDFTGNWITTSGAVQHWHECQNGCGEIADETNHTHINNDVNEKCSVCGHTRNHSYTSSVVTSPTCTAAGFTTYSCTCGKTYDADFVPATGHISWDTGVVIKEATCITTGAILYTCVCGETKTETTPITDHTYSSEWKKDANGHWNLCTVVGCSAATAPLPHSFGTDHICDVCNYAKQAFTISFDVDADGTPDAVYNRTVYAGDSYVLPGADIVGEKAGYVFVNKWECEGVKYDAGETIQNASKSVTYTACFAEPNDFIRRGIEESFNEFNTVYADLINTDFEDSELIVNKLVFNDTITQVNSKDAREQKISAKAELTSNSVKEIVKLACGAVYTLCTDDQPEKPVVKEWVYAVIAAVEEETGVDIKKSTKEEICDWVWNECVTRTQSFWSHFNNGENAYYTGDITLDVCGEKITLLVNEDENDLSVDVDGLWKDAATRAAIAMTKDMYGDLVKASNKNYVNSATLEAKVTLNFSAPKNDINISAADANGDAALMNSTYKQNANEYPFVYPITFTLNATCPEHVTYKTVAGEGAYVKLEVTENMQELYEEGVDYAVKKALKSNTVKNQVEKIVDDAIAELKEASTVKELINVMTRVNVAEADTRVDDALTAWKNKNVKIDNLAEGNVFKLIWNGSADFDNESIGALITLVGYPAGDYANEKIDAKLAEVVAELEAKKAEAKPDAVAESTLRAHLKRLGRTDAEIDALIAQYNGQNVYDEMIQAARDEANDMKANATPESLKNDMGAYGIDLGFDEEGYEDVEYYILACVADKLNNYGGRTPVPYAPGARQAALDQMESKIQIQIEDKVTNHPNYDDLQKALKAKDFDNLLQARLGNVAEILESEKLREKAYEEANKQIDKIESEEVKDKISKATEKFFENLVEYFEFVPDGATVYIDGKPLTKATVSALADAQNVDDILDVAVTLLRDPALKDLRVIDCAPSTPDYDNNDGLKVEATWQEYSATGHLVIEVK